MAYQIRNAPEELNESKTIGVSIYTVAIIGITAVPLTAALSSISAASLAIRVIKIMFSLFS